MEKDTAVQLLTERNFVKLKSELSEMNPADIAALVEEMDEFDEFGERELTLLYRILPKEIAAEVFTYMNSGENLLASQAELAGRVGLMVSAIPLFEQAVEIIISFSGT